ncbi:toxin-antitoxin system TumE family protein [Halonotius pteroides]|uniref:Uncharacterized protein n=1 Tax=Halonotius pteroides TaxID=268735 RepID=A0A3A6QNR2_9EURY|nr:DUF6516 family protein [Halonotius pteroides]RJX49525.1 hypothetical protein DP106_08640 [Halonotius pteroides]
MNLTDDELDGFTFRKRYADGTFIRLMIRRTAADAYPSGWRYALHYGAVAPDAVDRETLDDGTIRRYDNAHEATKGHELHIAPDPTPTTVQFPGMVELYDRFWNEIPKARINP